MQLRPTDPPPTLDLTIPAVSVAIRATTMQLRLIRQESPEMTPHEQLREAKRRCEREMVHAADAIEANERNISERDRFSWPGDGALLPLSMCEWRPEPFLC
jgi:hypothetical protein